LLSSLMLVLAFGCSKPRDRQAEVVRDVESLSHDVCLQNGLTEAERRRAVARAKTGKLTEATLDAYVDDVRKRRFDAEKKNMDVDTFCRMQVNAWKRHFGR